jgi:hypothetical protein
MYFSGLYNPCESQKISVFRLPWTVKNVFFGIPGHLETLKTGIVLIAAFIKHSTPKTALFQMFRKLRYGQKCEVMSFSLITF